MKKVFLITKIRSDHEGDFDSVAFVKLCDDNGFFHDFFSLMTPQQNCGWKKKSYFTRIC